MAGEIIFSENNYVYTITTGNLWGVYHTGEPQIVGYGNNKIDAFYNYRDSRKYIYGLERNSEFSTGIKADHVANFLEKYIAEYNIDRDITIVYELVEILRSSGFSGTFTSNPSG